MTQPPDDRKPLSDEPVEPAPEEAPPRGEPPAEPAQETSAPDAPTVAWSPPDASAPPPPSPIISADTSGAPPAPAWQVPTAPPPAGPVAAGGWQVPTTPTPAAQQQGYVVGGAGARLVAWLIDGTLSSIIPGAIALFVFDWASFFRSYFDQFQFDASGRLIPNANYTVTFPITLDIVLALLILVGIQFLYFVGFWTSRWQATPGMIGLKMRVVDANTGAPLTVVQAVKRWFAMGWWLTVLFLAPVLQNAVSLAQFAVNVFLFLSTVIDDRRRGFHDKFAGSQVIRSVTSGSGATIVGCLVYIVIVILITIIAVTVLFTAMGPELQRIMDQYPRNSA